MRLPNLSEERKYDPRCDHREGTKESAAGDFVI
jgi:hypothetical protein